ncbi:MAG: FAD-binding oxidoreductase, partial [Candidatus Sulfotelmatobacter sp.]
MTSSGDEPGFQLRHTRYNTCPGERNRQKENMLLQEHNYWLTTADFPRTETRPLPTRADVAIIGAGYTGLSAARTLAKRGAKVAVLESETIGWGASSR